MDALLSVEQWPVDHAAVGVVVLGPDRGASTSLGATPRGPQSDPSTTVGPSRQLFAWASVSKLATTLAVLVAVEEGTLALDEPAGPEGSTVRHLLAHASGLGSEVGLSPAAPGVARIYSNAGFAELGRLLAERSEMPFSDYLRQGVLEPLGMNATVLDSSVPAGGPAAGLAGPLLDLLALGTELAVPTLISPETHRDAVTVQFPDLAGVLPGFGRFDPCPWGLGVEIRGTKSPHWTGATNSPATFGHFGQSGSFLWVDPAEGVVCGGLSDRPFGLWARRAWPPLSDAVLAEVASGGAPATGS
jgi:CubicO group peptidase (beta-lactamase class C family)